MKQKYTYLLVAFFSIIFSTINAQETSFSTTLSSEQIFGLLELPFLCIALIFSFLTATRLKGGKFGIGMSLLAWGFVIMAIGHLHMQITHLFGYNLFKSLLGSVIGNYFWYLALIITWGLSALGFYKIYVASKI